MERRTEGVAPQKPSDRDLVLAFKAGNRAAYDEMYERYRARVYGVCRRILRDPQDAEEAAQETFLRAYQALHRFNGRYQLGAWLARIASNASVDQLRARTRAPLVGLPGDADPVSPDSDPERLVVGEHPRLTAAIGDVKPLHAQALALRELEGLSHQEIAQRLELSPPQVKALLHRARSSLRRAWERAEGWALAPIFSARALWGDRSGPAGSPLLSAGSSLSPLLAERVAATALVVAVALGGIPSSSFTTTTAPVQPAARPALQGKDVRPADVQVAAAAPADTHRVAVEEEARVESVTELVPRLIEDTIKGRDLDTDAPEKEENDQEGQVANGARDVVRDTIRQISHVLPGEGAGSNSIGL